MTMTDEYTAGVSPGDFDITADEPPEPDETPGQDAPYGWMTDPETGERRPRKRAGRPRKPPAPDEVAAGEPVERDQDHAPRPPQRSRSQPADAPMPRGGVIATGVNRLYRRAGRIVRAMDADIGTAIIECTRKDEPDELTVGEAWENLCKANPRIRRFVLNCLKGGAWGDLVMAHAPIGIALFMKPAVQKLLPWRRLAEAAAEPEEGAPEGEGGLPGGLTMGDVDQMTGLAEQQARRAFAKMGVQVTDEEMAEAVAQAQGMAGVPPGLRRQQPKRTTRAQRHG